MSEGIINVYGYIRVSTEGQAKKGYSLAEQQEEIKRFCKGNQYSLLNVFCDEGISGAKANEDELSIERDGLIADLKKELLSYRVAENA